MAEQFYVYMLCNKTRTTLYIGVTNDLERRIGEHRAKAIAGFTARYSLNRLVFYEAYADPSEAIAREKQLKGWRREKKDKLIEKANPRWNDLASDWFLQVPKSFDDNPRATALRLAHEDKVSDPSAPQGFAQDDGLEGDGA